MKKIFKRLSRKIRERFFERYFFMIDFGGSCCQYSTFTLKGAKKTIDRDYPGVDKYGCAFKISDKKGKDVVIQFDFSGFEDEKKYYEIDLRDPFKFGPIITLSDEDMAELERIAEENEPSFDFGL